MDACQIDDRVIVNFDSMSYPRFSQARNMVAFGFQKQEL